MYNSRQLWQQIRIALDTIANDYHIGTRLEGFIRFFTRVYASANDQRCVYHVTN